MSNSRIQGTASSGDVQNILSDQGYLKVSQMVWDTNSLSYVVFNDTMTGGGAGGGLTDAELRASAVPVSLTSVPSHAVTNAGTFAVQVTSAPTTTIQDGGGTISIDDGAGSITVDGTVGISGSVPVTGTFWQATQPVSWSGQTVAATQSGTWTVGNASGASAVNIQDGGNTITVDGTVTANISGSISNTSFAATQSGTWTVAQGAAGSADWRSDLRRGATPVFAAISASSSGDNTLVAADGTRKIKVLQYTIVSAGTVNTTFKSGAGTNLSGAMPLVANSGVASPFVAPGMGHLMETAVNQALVLNLSGAIAVTGHLTYILEA